MKEVKIKNTGSRGRVIGGRMCPGGGEETMVEVAALNDFRKATAGSHIFNNHMVIVDKDYVKKMAEKAKAAKESGNGDSASLLIVIDGLKEDIVALNAEIDDLNGRLEKDGSSEEKANEFSFDPEKHHIEHRGAGKWFVMDLEEKVYGPLSEEDRAKFENMIK